jgi:hypothetical protein
LEDVGHDGEDGTAIAKMVVGAATVMTKQVVDSGMPH